MRWTNACRWIVVMFAAVALALPATGAVAPRQPIKIGLYAALTGTFAASGRDLANGVTLALEQIGFQMAGRPVQLIVEDTQGDPSLALTKARKLAEQDRVHVLVGPNTSGEGYAVRDYLDGAKVPALFAVVSADDITQRTRSEWIIRTGWSSSQPSHPFGPWVYKRLGYRKVATISYDYAFGWEVVGGFQRTFEEVGGQVIQKLWAPVGTQDFAPYLAQVRRDADAVFAQFSGGDAIRFLRQYREFGLKGRIPLIGGGTLTDESVLYQMGDEALGIITPLHYSAALNTPINRAFIVAFAQRFRYLPGYRAEAGYVATQIIQKAAEALRGQVDDPVRFLQALKQVRITETPRGPIKFDAFGNPIQNIYIRRVDRAPRGLQNTVIDTIPNVSQFWTYEPKAFLAKPVYSRDYPGCPYCGR